MMVIFKAIKTFSLFLFCLIVPNVHTFACNLPYSKIKILRGGFKPRPYFFVSSRTQIQHRLRPFSLRGGSSEDDQTSSATIDEIKESSEESKIIPITILSGFLGSGKTTLLQHLLHNNDGLRIGIIVNDMASVNIDSKLVSRTSSSNGSDYEDMIELSNGCACCSTNGELLNSVSNLITVADLRQKGQYDHIVVELSGIAEPQKIRSMFQEASLYGMPLMERVQLDTMVTVVDCGSFLTHLNSKKVSL